MKYDIFISYRRSDRELVAHIVRKLEDRGASVWYDAEIEGGADWREIIVDALSSSDMLVIFFSEACNQSRQLKKELAVADNMEKPVVPILIEDTKPKGAYLYELADRNWLQAYPDPMSHAKDIVDHLIALAEKSPGGLEGIASSRPPSELMAEKSAPAPDAEQATPPDQMPRLEEAPDLIGDVFKSATPKPAEPRAQDYIGKKTKLSQKTQNLNDILPFKWIDLAFLVPLTGLTVWTALTNDINTGSDDPASHIFSNAMLVLAIIALYGAVVFPFRYFFRRRRLWTAFGKYTISSLILYVATIGVYTIGEQLGYFPYDDPVTIGLGFGAIWGGFAVVAFIIYAILGAQRLARNFRSNIQKI